MMILAELSLPPASDIPGVLLGLFLLIAIPVVLFVLWSDDEELQARFFKKVFKFFAGAIILLLAGIYFFGTIILPILVASPFLFFIGLVNLPILLKEAWDKRKKR